MKLLSLVFVLFTLSFNALACGTTAEEKGWRFDESANPYEIAPEEGAYWVFENPYRCPAAKRWVKYFWAEGEKAEAISFWQTPEKYFCVYRDKNGKPTGDAEYFEEFDYYQYRSMYRKLVALETAGDIEPVEKFPTCR